VAPSVLAEKEAAAVGRMEGQTSRGREKKVEKFSKARKDEL